MNEYFSVIYHVINFAVFGVYAHQASLHHASTKYIEDGKMSIYWVRSYYGKPGKVTEYLKWLNSDRAKLLASQIEKETGIKYLNTYTTIQSFGDYDAEDWWTAPDWA